MAVTLQLGALLRLAVVCVMASSVAQTVTQSPLLLRVDVQNLPSAAIGSGPMNVRVPPDVTLQDLKNTLREELKAMFDGHIYGFDFANFDIEVYASRADRFDPLTDFAQLSRRSRLNIILHKATNSNSPGNLLALPARMFAVDTTAGGFCINGHSVFVDEIENSGLGTGLTTWDGSVVLAKYLEHKFTGGLQGRRVLELGAGTGLVGLSAALLEGAREVILTDLDYTMANLKRNIQRTMAVAPHKDTHVEAQVLDWFKPRTDLGDIDLILASDVVWVEELIVPLVDTMQTVATVSQVTTTILMSHQQRSVVSDTILFRELEKRGFERRGLSREELHPEFTSDKIHLWELTLKY